MVDVSRNSLNISIAIQSKLSWTTTYISKPELPTMRIPNSFAFSVPKIRMAIEQRAQRSVGGFGAFSIFDLFTEESLSDCKSARPSYIPWLLW